MKEKIIVKNKLIIEASISGILFHGLYLGGVFYSISVGLPASISALIVSMHPIITNILAGPILKGECYMETMDRNSIRIYWYNNSIGL